MYNFDVNNLNISLNGSNINIKDLTAGLSAGRYYCNTGEMVYKIISTGGTGAITTSLSTAGSQTTCAAVSC